jgi:hypothetical protein
MSPSISKEESPVIGPVDVGNTGWFNLAQTFWGDRRPPVSRLFPQFKDGVQLLDIRGLSQTVGQVVASLLIPVQEVQKLANSIGPTLGLGSPVDGPARPGSRGETRLETADVGPLPFC